MARNWGSFAEGLVSGYQTERKASTEREEARLRMEAERQRMAALEAERKRASNERETIRRSGQWEVGQINNFDAKPGAAPTPAIPAPAAAPAAGAPTAPLQSLGPARPSVLGAGGALPASVAAPPAAAGAPPAPAIPGASVPPPAAPAAAATSPATAPPAQPAVPAQPGPDIAQLSARVRAHQSQIDMIEDPARRQAAQRNFDRQRIAGAAGPVSQAMSAAAAGNMADAAAKLNHAYTMTTGFEGRFSVDESRVDAQGKPIPMIVGPDGRPVGKNFMDRIVEVFGGDEVAALKAAEQLRAAAEVEERKLSQKDRELTEGERAAQATERLKEKELSLTERIARNRDSTSIRVAKMHADSAELIAGMNNLTRLTTDNAPGGAGGAGGAGGRTGGLDSKAYGELEAQVRASLGEYGKDFGYDDTRMGVIANIGTQIAAYATSRNVGVNPLQAADAAIMVDFALNGDKLTPEARSRFEEALGMRWQDLSLMQLPTGDYFINAGPTNAPVLIPKHMGDQLSTVMGDRALEEYHNANPMQSRASPTKPDVYDQSSRIKTPPTSALPGVRGSWGQ